MSAEHLRRDMRIKFLARGGINVADCSPEQWLQLAVDAESLRNAGGSDDPAFEYLFNRERYCLEAAAIAEATNPKGHEDAACDTQMLHIFEEFSN